MPSISKVAGAYKSSYMQNSTSNSAKHLLDRYDDRAQKKDFAKGTKEFKDILKERLADK